MNGSFYEAEGDSSASFINVDDADFQIVAYLADIARFLVVVIGHFVDVEQAGQTVFHLHFHIVPRWADRAMKGHGHAPMADAEQLKALATRIAAELD